VAVLVVLVVTFQAEFQLLVVLVLHLIHLGVLPLQQVKTQVELIITLVVAVVERHQILLLVVALVEQAVAVLVVLVLIRVLLVLELLAQQIQAAVVVVAVKVSPTALGETAVLELLLFGMRRKGETKWHITLK
jgi:hypothetical protein